MEKQKEKTLLVIDPGREARTDTIFHILVAETGEHLASHWCSSWHYALGDLYENRPERKEEWGKRFGGIEVKFLEDTDITREELIKRNKRRFKTKKEDV